MRLIDIIDQSNMTGMNILCHSIDDGQQIWVSPKHLDQVVGFPLSLTLNPEVLTISEFSHYDSVRVGGVLWSLTHAADDYLIDKLFPVSL
jgi:hypothetical protein